MNNDSYPTLMEVAQKVWAKSSGRQDYETTLGDFVAGFTGLTKVNSPTGELVLTPGGFRQLAADRLGMQPAFFSDNRYPPEFKVQALQYAAVPFSDTPVKVRVAGNQIEAVVSNDYSFFDNGDLLGALVQLQQGGQLPAETRVMSHYLSPTGRDLHLRLVSPEWDFVVKERSMQQPFHGNLILTNNEIALASFRAQVAITRTACTNSTIGSNMFAVNHKFASRSDFMNELGKAVRQVGGWSGEMRDGLQKMQNINVESPLLIFDKIGESLGVPKYALNHAKTYWQDEGSQNSLYDIVQAVAAGARDVTVPEGRRKPSWTNRSAIEQQVWAVAEELVNQHAEGNSIENWYMGEDQKLIERIAKLVEGYKAVTPVAEEIAARVRELELN